MCKGSSFLRVSRWEPPALQSPRETPAGRECRQEALRRAPRHRPAPRLPESLRCGTEPNTATISITLLACLRKITHPQLLAAVLRTTPFRVCFTLNPQARDPPVGLHKAELLVQGFLKNRCKPDPKKLKGYYGNTQLNCFVTI